MNTQNLHVFQQALDSLASLLPLGRQNKQGFQLPQASSLSHSTGAFFKQTAWETVAVLELPKHIVEVPEQVNLTFEPHAISMHLGDYFKQVSWSVNQSPLVASSQEQAPVLPGPTVIGNSVFGFFANTAWSGTSHQAFDATEHSIISQSPLTEDEPEMIEPVENFFADIRW